MILLFQYWGFSAIIEKAMMTSSNGNFFCVTGPLCGEFTGRRWIPLIKASDAELWCLICARINDWVNNREAGDSRRHRSHYDVTVIHWRDGLCLSHGCMPFGMKMIEDLQFVIWYEECCARSRYQGRGQVINNYIPQYMWDVITCP